MKDFKFPGVGLPFSLNPNPSSAPIVLIERETADISNLSTKEYYEEQRRKITRRVLDVFYLDLGFAHHSASMQMCPTHHLHGAYDRLARENRERLEAERAQEAEQLKRLRSRRVA